MNAVAYYPMSDRVHELVAHAANIFYVPPHEILSVARFKNTTAARQCVMWTIRTRWKPQPSFPEIGRMLWCAERARGYDHTTVMAAVKHIDREVSLGNELGLLALQVAGEL